MQHGQQEAAGGAVGRFERDIVCSTHSWKAPRLTRLAYTGVRSTNGATCAERAAGRATGCRGTVQGERESGHLGSQLRGGSSASVAEVSGASLMAKFGVRGWRIRGVRAKGAME